MKKLDKGICAFKTSSLMNLSWTMSSLFRSRWRRNVALKAGDVLLTRKGTFGVAAAVPQDAEDCLISSEIILLRLSPKSECSSEYLVAWLNSSIAKTLLDRNKAGGIMGHLTQDVVAEFPVPIPTPQVQRRIVEEVGRRRDQAQRLRKQAASEWKAAKAQFEERLWGIGLKTNKRNYLNFERKE